MVNRPMRYEVAQSSEDAPAQKLEHQFVWEPDYCPYGLYVSITGCAISTCTLLILVGFVVWQMTRGGLTQ